MKINEKYRDSVFRMLVNNKAVALEIYNAMNGSDYDNEDDIIVTTLRNAVYMGVKNDASFIIASQLMLYEQQSTVNPNMPLRDLEYVACIMAALTYDANIYSRRLIRLPEPKFVVFYNGEEMVPERYEMKLSDYVSCFRRKRDMQHQPFAEGKFCMAGVPSRMSITQMHRHWSLR